MNAIIDFLQSHPSRCSLYTLPTGTLELQDSQGSLRPKSHLLPAYLLTNCTESHLQSLASEFQNWSPQTPSTINDIGDAFVSLLFTISGTCITGWMLCLMLLLSPSHKQKTIMTQVATVFYTIVMTILMAKVTNAGHDDYYSDQLNIIHIHDVLYNNMVHRVTDVFSELFIQMAMVELFGRLSHRRFKMVVMSIMSVVVIAHTIVSALCEARYDGGPGDVVFLLDEGKEFLAWSQARMAVRLALMVAFVAALAYYTIMIKSPTKYSYSRRLVPISVFVWLMVLGHVVTCVLIISIYEYRWQIRSWLLMLPSLLEIGILSMTWEWIYDIQGLEKRSELMGILGRRISVDDVTIFQDHSTGKRRGWRGWRGWLQKRMGGVEVQEENESKTEGHGGFEETDGAQVEVIDLRGGDGDGDVTGDGDGDVIDNDNIDHNDTNAGITNTNLDTNTNPQNTNTNPQNTNPQNTNPQNTNTNTETTNSTATNPQNPTTETTNTNTPSHNPSPTSSTEYINDYEYFDDPPPFVPHPGFSPHDYYREK